MSMGASGLSPPGEGQSRGGHCGHLLLRRQHQMFIGRARIHGVRLIGIGDVHGSRIAHHFSHPWPDHHDVRTGLHPMLARFLLIRMVVGGAGIPGQHG